MGSRQIHKVSGILIEDPPGSLEEVSEDVEVYNLPLKTRKISSNEETKPSKNSPPVRRKKSVLFFCRKVCTRTSCPDV
jgi:hypothetical protein